MASADLRPLLRITPETGARLVGSITIAAELHSKIHEEFAKNRVWGSPNYSDETDEVQRLVKMAMARLAGINGLFVEPYTAAGQVSSVLVAPDDIDARIELAGAIAIALAAETSWRLDSADLVRWALAPAILAHKLSWYPNLDKFDPALSAELARLRRRAFEPWLEGQVPVRHHEAFRAFHLGLDPASQQLVYAASNNYGLLKLDEPSVKPETAWAYGLHEDLVAAGWLRLGPPTVKSVQLVPGLWSHRLAPGEMGPGY